MKTTFCDFQAVMSHLDGLGLHHVDLSLGRMQSALTALGLTRPPFVTVQVIGTNGKGSTAAFLASLCAAHGCRTGLYTSPHFVSPAERIRIDGRSWPDEYWAEEANKIMAVAPDLTYFEFLTVLTLLAFAREKVDVAILEAGLGGRHDATTAVDADIICFTPIAMDHQDVLGTTQAEIAADKAGAVRGAAPLCSAPQFPDTARQLEAAALQHGVPLYQASPLPASRRLGLHGPHQRVNAGLALTAWQQLAAKLGKNPHDTDAQDAGLASAYLPGRLQWIPATEAHPPLLLDGAHNPHGTAALVSALMSERVRPAGAIFACLADKDWRSSVRMLKNFLGDAPLWIPTLNNPRAARAEEVAEACNTLVPTAATPLPDLSAALAAAAKALHPWDAERPLLLTGSLYLLSEFYALHPEVSTSPLTHAAKAGR